MRVRVADHLRSWWRENPFLSGVHWTSGIELGIRLISLAWIRRLLDDWPGIADLFERDALAVRQIRWHQQYLAAFPSRGSSANNHVIAEAAGQLVASCAFPWFAESERWRRKSARLLERELIRNTFPSGIGRELASDYQCFIAELGLLAAVEAEASGHPLSPVTWERLCAMADSAAALVDERLRPPRQGDSDEGRGAAARRSGRQPLAVAAGARRALVGRLDWWPRPPADAAQLDHRRPGRAQAPHRGQAQPAAVTIRRRGETLLRTTGRKRDLVPVRRRPARIPQHRRACPRRRPVRRGPLRGRGYPCRPGHLLLSRRARMAFIFPVDDRAQYRRARRPEPVQPKAARSCGCVMRMPGSSR